MCLLLALQPCIALGNFTCTSLYNKSSTKVNLSMSEINGTITEDWKKIVRREEWQSLLVIHRGERFSNLNTEERYNLGTYFICFSAGKPERCATQPPWTELNLIAEQTANLSAGFRGGEQRNTPTLTGTVIDFHMTMIQGSQDASLLFHHV